MKLSYFESSAFFLNVLLVRESALCLWIQVHHLVDSRVSYVDSDSNPLEEQGLWIQDIVLHCSCSKGASSARVSLVRILSFLLFLSWWRALKRRSNDLEIMWILLEARHLNSFKNSFKGTCMFSHTYFMIGSSVLGASMFWTSDSIYYVAFNVLIKISESLSTSKSIK